MIVFRYYFPTYENDSLLCKLPDSDSDLPAQEQKGGVPVISEDTSRLWARRQSSVLNQLLLPGGRRALPQETGGKGGAGVTTGKGGAVLGEIL